MFTTIRGKSWATKLKNKTIAIAKTPNGEFSVEIKNAALIRLGDIPLDALKRDGDYEGKEINSYEDFLETLNSLRRIPPMPRATLDSEVTMITLGKL